MKLKRKIFAIFLSCFLVISSTVSSFAFAPVVALAPEIVSAIATTLVCAGVKFADYNTLNKSVRDVYETEGFITKCLPYLEQDIKNSKHGVVTLSKNVVDFFKDIYFPKVVFGQNIIFSEIPCYRLSQFEYDTFFRDEKETLDFPISPVWNVPFNSDTEIVEGNFKIVHKSGERFVKFFLNNKLLGEVNIYIPGYKSKVSLLFFSYNNVANIQPVTLLEYKWYRHGDNLLSRYQVETGSKFWENIGGLPYLDVPSDSTLDIPVAGDVTDLVGVDVWNPSADQVWNPSNPVDIPQQGDGDLVVPGDSIIDTPVDPPVDPPIDPPVDVPTVGIDFSPFINAMNNFKEKFPFSLPWDFKRVFDVLNVPSKSPSFNLPLAGFEFNIEFSRFDLWIRIFKYFIYLIFVLGLIFITNKLKP